MRLRLGLTAAVALAFAASAPLPGPDPSIQPDVLLVVFDDATPGQIRAGMPRLVGRLGADGWNHAPTIALMPRQAPLQPVLPGEVGYLSAIPR
ncbi:MAG: hypothetical protein KatS3mg014_2536 [Actinomycetota bacterium]|nr:MAG: hypothetical protein KatS3mg014_2469 [Actinomycetota bacterium]GIV00921.1 MAG: hypothetical protein KatS3mg014_2536 [Actinomycetota bacterium]